MKILPAASLIGRRGLDGEEIPAEPEDNRVGTKIIYTPPTAPIVQGNGGLGGLLLMPVDAAKAVFNAVKGKCSDVKKMANTPVGELK